MAIVADQLSFDLIVTFAGYEIFVDLHAYGRFLEN